ncbi:four-carbon acid sugar kinase family protein [Ancylobacter dichloromethanicus]
MEVLSFAGLPTVLFLGTPTPDQLARFNGMRAVGIAGVARSMPPEWMDAHLPAVFEALARIGAPLAHYKVCSTFDLGTACRVDRPGYRDRPADPRRRLGAAGRGGARHRALPGVREPVRGH